MATQLISAQSSEAATQSPRQLSAIWPVALYALTGFSGVLAEQSFEKYIALLVGATAFSSAIVIFAYFLGFALGAWATSTFIRRRRLKRPLFLYGVIELLVGITCVGFTYGFPPLIGSLAAHQSPDASASAMLAARFAFGAIFILPTALLMGASFPLIARVLDASQRSEDAGRLWVLAYGANLSGAIAAAIGGAYLILPFTGLRGAMWLCFGISVAVFAVCSFLPEPFAEARSTECDGPREAVENGSLLLATAFCSGLVFFALEVLWTHLLGTLLGSSIYAFASMLAAVLIGLLLGSIRARRAKKSNPLAFARLLQMSAFLLIAQYRMWDYIQIGFLTPIPEAIKSFYTIEAFKFLLAAIMIVPPAALLGSLYPMLLRSPALNRASASYFAGYLNAANSVGCLLGSILGVFFLIPVLGSEWSLKLLAFLLFASGLVVLLSERPPRKVLINALVGGVLVFGYAAWARWDGLLLTSGLNVSFGRPEKKADAPSPSADPKTSTNLVFFEEHAQGGFTTVVQFDHSKSPAQHMLLTNGKFEGVDDLKAQGFAQISFAAIPSQFTSGFDRALQIGLGTGQSAQGLVKMGFHQVDIAEYSPGIVHAADKWFRAVNGGVVTEPGVRLHLEDGRNFLLTDRDRPFDLISIEITSIWFAGATNLYSREFYELAKSRLRPGGAFQQWIQFHHTTPRELAVQLATLRSVFPYVTMWGSGGQGMLVATDRPQLLTPERRAYMTGRFRLLDGVPESQQSALEREVFDSQLLDPAGIERVLRARPSPINTDENRWIEYATPRYNWTENEGAGNVAWLRGFAQAGEH